MAKQHGRSTQNTEKEKAMRSESGSSSEAEVTAQVICEEHRIVAGRTVVYRLLALPPQYAMELQMGKEICRIEVGEAHPEAERIFALMVKGLVTPCSAPYIWEDLNA